MHYSKFLITLASLIVVVIFLRELGWLGFTLLFIILAYIAFEFSKRIVGTDKEEPNELDKIMTFEEFLENKEKNEDSDEKEEE